MMGLSGSSWSECAKVSFHPGSNLTFGGTPSAKGPQGRNLFRLGGLYGRLVRILRHQGWACRPPARTSADCASSRRSTRRAHSSRGPALAAGLTLCITCYDTLASIGCMPTTSRPHLWCIHGLRPVGGTGTRRGSRCPLGICPLCSSGPESLGSSRFALHAPLQFVSSPLSSDGPWQSALGLPSWACGHPFPSGLAHLPLASTHFSGAGQAPPTRPPLTGQTPS